MELDPLKVLGRNRDDLSFLLSGVGPVEAAMNLTDFLARDQQRKISAVINVGIGGAYPDSDLNPLDVCLADHEVFADIGVALGDTIEELDKSFSPPLEFSLDQDLLSKAATGLNKAAIEFKRGNFITVSAASGTTSRSRYLRDKFSAICENMEGAAIARVCQKFSLPSLELRCISNMVVDRKEQHWLTKEAVAGCGRALQAVMEVL